MFVDESGLCERPSLVRSWARKAKARLRNGCSAPLGQTVCDRRHLWMGILLLPSWGSIKSRPAVEFFLRGTCRAQIRGRLLILWAGLAVQGTRPTCDYVEHSGGQLVLAQLPAYAPELHPFRIPRESSQAPCPGPLLPAEHSPSDPAGAASTPALPAGAAH